MPVKYTVTPFDPETIGPDGYRKGELFRLYAQKMEPKSPHEFEDIIISIIHGETRVLCTRMTIDSINDDREAFRKNVIDRVQDILYPLGVQIDNANIAELKEEKRPDVIGYLEAREKKKLSDATQSAEIDVAEATRKGDIGKMENEALARADVAKWRAMARTKELEAEKEIAQREADRDVVLAEALKMKLIANVTTEAAQRLKDEELQKGVEEARQERELAAMRALQLSKAKVEAECLLTIANAKRDADVMQADGEALAIERKATALLIQLKAEAEGEAAKLEAQATGTEQMVLACGDTPPETIMGIHAGIPQKVAEEQAKAVANMKPQLFSVSGNDLSASVSGLISGLTPVVAAFRKMQN